jgi:hypothetical protein
VTIEKGVDFLHRAVSRVAVSLLDAADELFGVATDPVDIIIGQLAPLRFDCAPQLEPLSFESIRVHDLILPAPAKQQCLCRLPPGLRLKAIAIRRMNTTVKHPDGESAIGWSAQRRMAAMLPNDRRPRAMAASLHFIGSVELITIALDICVVVQHKSGRSVGNS